MKVKTETASRFTQFRRLTANCARRGIEASICAVLLIGTPGLSAFAQSASAPASSASSSNDYSTEQLDALLAPIALYPDQLLTQILMASTYPLEIVEAYQWQQEPSHSSLTGDALTTALEKQSWDPSVKSLIPFPQVLSMMDSKLDWVQQLGYAMTNQQSQVMDSVQHLRQQAQQAGQLQSNTQQTVSSEGQNIIIAPAQPTVVYVPSYNPAVVYGAWPYAAYPPVYFPPPPGAALAAGIAFGVGVAVTASLWGWAHPVWGGGWGGSSVNVNVNRYNNINVNRAQINRSSWNANVNRPKGAGGFNGGRPGGPPPGGPVGRPGGNKGGLPSNAIGRNKVNVPGNITRPPNGIGGNRPNGGNGNRPNGGINGNKPGGGNGPASSNRPNGGGLNGGNKPGGGMGGGNRPNGGGLNGGGNKPVGGNGFGGGNKPAGGFNGGSKPGGGNRPSGGGNRNPGAFSGMNQGHSASQFGNRGAQSRSFSGGGGGRSFGGGGGGRMGGGGGRRR